MTSAICNSEEGAQNRARTRIEAITDQGISSRAFGHVFSAELGKAELVP